MNAPVLNVDLHCHSKFSDGMLTPDELASRAHTNGVDAWALTDHDELAGLAEAADAAQAVNLRFFTGVEISVTWAAITLHILGLRFDPRHAGLTQGLQQTRSGRVARAQRIGERLADLGMPGAFEGALRLAENPQMISRTHFARYLVAAGYCPDVQTVFTKYLGDHRPGNVRIQWATLSDAVGWIRGAGGLAVIAHPGRYAYTPVQFAALFDEFLQLGGVGIEVMTGSHSAQAVRQYAKIARRYGFLASRGSDFHSPMESRVDLGRLPPLPADLTPIWHDWF
jgi:predicted metal-dependent phosphoesterase TrpH